VPSEPTACRERRLRVAVVPEQFPRGVDDFAGIFTRDYVEAIRPHCDVVVVLVQEEGQRRGAQRTRAAEGVEYVTCTPAIRDGGHGRQRLGRLEGLYRISRTAGLLRDVDVIHAHGAVFHGVPAVTLGRELGLPVVLTIHTGPFSKLLRRKTTGFLTRRTLERVDCVCPVSEDLLRQIEGSGIRPRRAEVTYNPVDTSLFRSCPPGGQGHRRILFAGRLEEYKGGLRVARAFASIADHLPGWRLTIAGGGPEREAIRAFVDASPALNARVELTGSFTRAQLADLLGASDFFVYPSRHETFGLVLAEAMSAGLPVVAPDRTAPPEFVDDRSGVLVAPDDVAAIANAMEHVALNLARFDRDAIRQAVVERFGFEVFGERLVALYRSLVPSPGFAGGRSCAG
jgi:glycosyltransferase involved in cell wall biosynthesis